MGSLIRGPRTACDRLTRWLIASAARAAPVPLRERLAEEWSADLAVRRSLCARLGFALGCCWATRVIAFERATVAVAAAASVSPVRTVFAGFGRDRAFTRRSATLVMVVALHVALIYALMHGLAAGVVPHLPSTMQTRWLDQPQRRDLPPPPPPPVVDRRHAPPNWPDLPPPPRVPDEPDGSAATPRDGEPTGASGAASASGGDASAPKHVTVRVEGGPGRGFPNPDDYYPPLAKAMDEQGAATVRVCVDAKGRLTAEPTVIAGTNSRRLDAGALQLARAGSGHYQPTLEDGVPVASCYAFRVRFRLRN